MVISIHTVRTNTSDINERESGTQTLRRFSPFGINFSYFIIILLFTFRQSIAFITIFRQNLPNNAYNSTNDIIISRYLYRDVEKVE